jgi:hypothetical protein
MSIQFILVVAFVLVAFVAAQLPTFPDNIIVFPNRDIVNVLGFNGGNLDTKFSGRKMQTLLVRTVNAISTIVGESFPTVSGKTIAYDVNHPFGYCWGVGSQYQVTPDIQAGDQIILKMDGIQVASSTVLPVKITAKSLNYHVITMAGSGVSSLPDPTFMDCRIVQPALVNTIVGRRDVRAIPGGNFPNAVGYISSLVIDGDTFTCIFSFFDAANVPNPLLAESAFVGSMEVSSWQFTDTAGNAQGMTIFEFGHLGGPMDSSCPPSASFVAPIAPNAIAYDGKRVYWNVASNILGTSNPFNFYQVEALRANINNNPVTENINGYRTTSEVQSVTFSSRLNTGDVLAVRAWSFNPAKNIDILSVTEEMKVVVTNKNPLPPTFSIPSGTLVDGLPISLISSQNLQIAYTITPGKTGITPVLGSSNTFIFNINHPIEIVGIQTIVAWAFDTNGRRSSVAIATYINNTPGKVSSVTAVTTALSKITVAWAPYTSSQITGFRIYAINGTTQTLIKTTTTASPFWTDVTSGLIGGESYFFVVSAINMVDGITYEGPVSELSLAPAVFLQDQTDLLTYTIKYTPGTELRVFGTGSIDAAQVTVMDAATGTVLGSGAVSLGTFLIRIRPIPSNIFSIHIFSSFGFSAMYISTI